MTTTAMPQTGQLTNPLYNPDRVQTVSDAPSARGAFPGGKAARASDNSLLPPVELKKECSSTPYTFVAYTGTMFCFHVLLPPSMSRLFINLPVV